MFDNRPARLAAWKACTPPLAPFVNGITLPHPRKEIPQMSPHEKEYLGAVAGMAETYGGRTIYRDGKLTTTYAIGDRIKWLENGETLSGVVVEVLTEDTYHVRRHVPDHGSLHYAVTEEQTVPF
jgi:hypothetical protein